MLNYTTRRTGLTAGITLICLLIITGCGTAQTAKTNSAATDEIQLTAATTNLPSPGPDDSSITYVTARILEGYHYLQQPLDQQLSAKFFDQYIDSLDPRHENFLQSDLAEFDHYRTNLDTLTETLSGKANLKPAFQIYDRYVQRSEEHAQYAFELLKADKFKFTTGEKFLYDRRHLPFPKDMDEAKALWEQRLRYEFLQEKLSKEFSPTNDTEIVPLPKDYAEDVAKTLERHYRWELHLKTNLDHEGVLSVYLNAMTHAYDPHSDYFSPTHAEDFSIGMNLGLFGIGAQLHEDDGYCTIFELVPGGPADKGKDLKPNDRIIAVGQSNQPPVDVVDMELDKVVQLIRGPKGTQVRLTVSPAENRTSHKIITITRDEIHLEDQEAKARLILMPDGQGHTNRIGFIDLPSFYAPVGDEKTKPSYTSVDVATLIKKLKKENIDGLIIDLRFNPGGSLDEAIKFTGLFIKDGPVVLARNSDGQVTVDSDNDSNQLYDGPLAVMINRYSASAAEIAAAALQDYGRAVIIGDTSTHGKGTVQSLLRLNNWIPAADAGTAKVTIRKFYRVTGASTQLKGVVPDIILPDVFNFSTSIGETNLDNPLPWDTIKSPANYTKFNLVDPYITELKSRSDARITTNQDFRYVQQDIEQLQKLQLEKTATLNEQEAITQRLHIAKVNHERQDERDSRPVSTKTIYELNLAECEKPGLPAPVPYYSTNSVSVTSTNTVGSTNNSSTNSTPTETAANTKPKVSGVYAPDPMLDETEYIMADYISLLTANKGVTVTK